MPHQIQQPVGLDQQQNYAEPAEFMCHPKKSRDDVVHKAILILLTRLGGEAFLEQCRTKHERHTVTIKERKLHCFMFSTGKPCIDHAREWTESTIRGHLRLIIQKRADQQREEVITRGQSADLTEALLVVADSNTKALYQFLQKVCKEVYCYTDGGQHICNYPAIKDVA